MMKQLKCNKCGAVVSTPVPQSTMVRGWIECVECIEKSKSTEDLEEKISSLEMDLETFSANALKAMEIKDKEIHNLREEIKRLEEVIDKSPCQLCDIGDFRASCTCKKKKTKTEAPEWLTKQFDIVEKEISQWSEEKRERFNEVISLEEHVREKQRKNIAENLRKMGLITKKVEE